MSADSKYFDNANAFSNLSPVELQKLMDDLKQEIDQWISNRQAKRKVIKKQGHLKLGSYVFRSKKQK